MEPNTEQDSILLLGCSILYKDIILLGSTTKKTLLNCACQRKMKVVVTQDDLLKAT